MSKKIAYQGVQGAYSEQACKNAYENYETIACDTFQEAMWMVEHGDADLAMIPLENSTAGRVEEIYRLIPKMSLHVIAEHFEPIVHCLIGLPGTKIEALEYVASHPQALAQCHNNILSLGLKAEAKLDTAGAAKELGMKVAMGTWIRHDPNDQIDNLIMAAQAGFVDMAVLGNEELYYGACTVEELINVINEVRQRLADVGCDNIPIAIAKAQEIFAITVVTPENVANIAPAPITKKIL